MPSFFCAGRFLPSSSTSVFWLPRPLSLSSIDRVGSFSSVFSRYLSRVLVSDVHPLICDDVSFILELSFQFVFIRLVLFFADLIL